jgi:hypothetical protein
VHSEGRLHVASIEPLGSLVFHRINQSTIKELFLLILMELNPAPTQDRDIVGFRVRLQTEEIAKKSDGRKDAKESFTEMYERQKDGEPRLG